MAMLRKLGEPAIPTAADVDGSMLGVEETMKQTPETRFETLNELIREFIHSATMLHVRQRQHETMSLT